MENKLNPKLYYSFGKVSKTVRRNSEPYMKFEPHDTQQVVPGDQTVNLWSTFPCEANTTLYDSNSDSIKMKSAQVFNISDSESNAESLHQNRSTEPLPHPSKLRKKRPEKLSTISKSEKRNGIVEHHLSQLISKQMTRMNRSKFPSNHNENKEFYSSEYQNPESIFPVNDSKGPE